MLKRLDGPAQGFTVLDGDFRGFLQRQFSSVRLGASERKSMMQPSSRSPECDHYRGRLVSRISKVARSFPFGENAPMASAKISCFETASNSVMHDRNFIVVGRAEDIGYRLFACRQNEARAFEQARSEHIVLQVSDGLGARGDCEALRHRRSAER
jgi:hypothetical protein